MRVFLPKSHPEAQLRIVLLTPRRRFIANQFGLGYQLPLGLVLLGGPLLDAGHQVRLIDNDVIGWDDQKLAQEVARLSPDCIMLGHTGSTAAHPVAMQTAQALRAALPKAKLVYGGVYPSYAARAVLRDNIALDVIVRGEGEETVVELARVLAEGKSLADVKGIVWRDGAQVRVNSSRMPLVNLDRFRPGWELVDWDAYQLFGFGRAAGMQFSRGCPLHCTYCGQWGFWRQWRHRSPANFVAELETLARRYAVKIVWLADENFAADRDVTREVLEHICERRLGLSLNVNMTVADVVRDADLLGLYKRAGVDNVVMGVEALEDALVDRIGKNNPQAVSRQAVALLRQHDIVSLVNIMYGLADESWTTVWRTLQQLFALDADVLNAVYLTPHFWTADGRRVQAAQIIQADQARWTYRNQVIQTPHLKPWQLFALIKLTEGLFHLRPRALWRMIAGGDARHRQILRAYLKVGVRVVMAEIVEFLRQTQFVAVGSLTQAPGYPQDGALKQENYGSSELRVEGQNVVG